MAANPSAAGSSANRRLPIGTRGITVTAAAAAIAGAGVGVGITIAANHGTPAPAPGGAAQSTNLPYDYYRSMMATFGGSMMGGPYGWMMGRSGYQWMVGGAQPPAWMVGSALPGFMMGSGSEPGAAMGRFWAGAPGARIDAASAQRLASAIPAGASVDAAANRITFSTHDVRLDIIASPSSADDRFELAGLINPTIAVPAGASVTVKLINGDSGSAHGMAFTTAAASPSAMPMMTDRPAFSGSAVWFLGDATAAGMHAATTTFTASAAGLYQYLCPVPGHAQHGMYGTLVVGSKS